MIPVRLRLYRSASNRLEEKGRSCDVEENQNELNRVPAWIIGTCFSTFRAQCFCGGSIRCHLDGHRRRQERYEPACSDLDTTAGNQWGELKDFFNAQPPTTYISVSYARNGTARVVQDFTNDHALAGKALRLPLGVEAFSSPYFALQDLMKRWPSSADRRSILLISSGIDYFHGNFPTSPDLDPTIERAQKENINVWSIYFPDTGHRSRRFFVANRGQWDLSRLSEETGAESYYLGIAAPVTFKPYLDEIREHLNNQYLLSFKASGGTKGRFERAHVTTELPKVEFFAATQVRLPVEDKP